MSLMVEAIKYLEITWCANNCYYANKLWSKQNTLMRLAENAFSRLKAKFKQKTPSTLAPT